MGWYFGTSILSLSSKRDKDACMNAKQHWFLLNANQTTFCLPQRWQSQEQPISQYPNSLWETHTSYQNLQFYLLEFPGKKKEKKNCKMTHIPSISDHKLPWRILLTSFQLLSKNRKAAHPSSTKINSATKIEYFVHLRKLTIIRLKINACIYAHKTSHTKGEWKRNFTHFLY
jgi:hypothetical protein